MFRKKETETKNENNVNSADENKPTPNILESIVLKCENEIGDWQKNRHIRKLNGFHYEGNIVDAYFYAKRKKELKYFTKIFRVSDLPSDDLILDYGYSALTECPFEAINTVFDAGFPTQSLELAILFAKDQLSASKKGIDVFKDIDKNIWLPYSYYDYSLGRGQYLYPIELVDDKIIELAETCEVYDIAADIARRISENRQEGIYDTKCPFGDKAIELYIKANEFEQAGKLALKLHKKDEAVIIYESCEKYAKACSLQVEIAKSDTSFNGKLGWNLSRAMEIFSKQMKQISDGKLRFLDAREMDQTIQNAEYLFTSHVLQKVAFDAITLVNWATSTEHFQTMHSYLEQNKKRD